MPAGKASRDPQLPFDRQAVQTVDGHGVYSFRLDYPTYGELLTTDLTHFFAADVNWNIYAGFADNQHLLKKGYAGYKLNHKLLNLMLSNSDEYLLTSGTGSDWDK